MGYPQNYTWSDQDELSDGSKNKAKAKRPPNKESSQYGNTAKDASVNIKLPAGIAAMDTHNNRKPTLKGPKSLPRP